MKNSGIRWQGIFLKTLILSDAKLIHIGLYLFIFVTIKDCIVIKYTTVANRPHCAVLSHLTGHCWRLENKLELGQAALQATQHSSKTGELCLCQVWKRTGESY